MNDNDTLSLGGAPLTLGGGASASGAGLGPDATSGPQPDAKPGSQPGAALHLGGAVGLAAKESGADQSRAGESGGTALGANKTDGVHDESGQGASKWNRAAENLGPKKATSAPLGADASAAGGAWIWLPQGPGPKVPWRKRHPLLFWGAVILLLGLAFGWGRMSVTDSPITGPKIAVVNVEGVIMDASSVVAWMEKVGRDDTYKGAIIRINSPGGAVGPSQEIFAAVKRLAQKKPTVTSMGALAASGGYYAALGADSIVAGPSTLTASIGVRMQIPNIGELMRTIGISETTLTTGKLKDAGSSWRDMTPEEEAYFRALIGDMYDEFVETVARERKLPQDKVRALADGRAMTGRQALEAGLVDSLGDLYAAAQIVRERAGLGPGEAKLEEGPEKPTSWLNELVGAVMRSAFEHNAAATQPVFMY